MLDGRDFPSNSADPQALAAAISPETARNHPISRPAEYKTLAMAPQDDHR